MVGKNDRRWQGRAETGKSDVTSHSSEWGQTYPVKVGPPLGEENLPEDTAPFH